MRHQRLDDYSPPGQVPHSFSSSPSCGTSSQGAVILHSGVGLGVSPPGGGRQDAPEGSSGARGPAESGLLQLVVPSRESDRGLEARHLSLSAQQIH